MRPVVTPDEMAAIDADAVAAGTPVEELIARAGWAVAREALAMLDGAGYGRRVAVLAGKGNNGADGRAAVAHLERRGARCTVLDHPWPEGERLPFAGPFDLIIDACYGTGLGRDFHADHLPIDAGDTPVLAVDVPSGVDGRHGGIRGHPLCATRTVTFAAAKPGLLVGDGPPYAGTVVVADIGLDCGRASISHLERADLVEHWPKRAPDAHKWRHAVHVIGGGPGMTGAPGLSARGALRAGAGYATVSTPAGPGGDPGPRAPFGSGSSLPVEAVERPLEPDWGRSVGSPDDRHGAVVIGPGLAAGSEEELTRYLMTTGVPTVLDAGAIDVVAAALADGVRLDNQGDGGPLHVLTPHDGEFARLTGDPPGADRIGSTRAAARSLGAVVLLKGPGTVVAHPDGRVHISTAGDQRLATAGTGDVLSGVIAAGIACGLDPFLAAGLGAELHGRAASRGYRVGATAGDLPSGVAAELSQLAGG